MNTGPFYTFRLELVTLSSCDVCSVIMCIRSFGTITTSFVTFYVTFFITLVIYIFLFLQVSTDKTPKLTATAILPTRETVWRLEVNIRNYAT
jgi:hypothetical protein